MGYLFHRFAARYHHLSEPQRSSMYALLLADFIWVLILVPTHPFVTSGGFPDSSSVKSLPATQEPQETQVPSPEREEPLGEEMATCSTILA